MIINFIKLREMKQIRFLITCLLLCVNICVSAEVVGGSCGDGYQVEWSVDTSKGILTITGNGFMKNYGWDNNEGYDRGNAPWYNYRDYITSLKIETTGPGYAIYIGNYAFKDLYRLMDVDLSRYVNFNYSIGAFNDCSSLKNVILYSDISTFAFAGCTSLESVTFDGICDGGNESVFYRCQNLKELYIRNVVPCDVGYMMFDEVPISSCVLHVPYFSKLRYQSADVWKDFGNIIGECQDNEINFVNAIDSWIWYNWYKWYEFGDAQIIDEEIDRTQGLLVFDRDITEITRNTFGDLERLTDIIIPNKVQTIGELAFYGAGLTNITIPNSVTTIGECAFAYCENLKDVYVNRTTPLTIELNVFDNTPINEATLHVPYGTKSLYEAAAAWKDFGTIVENNPNLTIDYVSTDGKVIVINDYWAFGEAIIVGNEYCSGKGTITFNRDITTIKENAFYENTNLKSIIIPNSVTTIGGRAFYKCSNLTNVNLPKSLTSINNGTFFHCTKLKSIEIPNRVSTIGGSAFSGCRELTSVTIPASVNAIGDHAFENSGLTNLYVEWDESNDIVSLSFYSLFPYNQCTLYVQSGTKDLYKAKDYWKTFKSIKEYTKVYIEDKDGSDKSVIVDENHTDFTLYDGINSISVPEEIEGVNVTYSRIYKTTSWAPWYMPFDLVLTDDVLQDFEFAKYSGAYTDEYDANDFVLRITRLHSGDIVKGNTPYFVKAKTADDVNPQAITANNVDLLTTDENSIYALSMEKRLNIFGLYSAKTATADDMNWYYYSTKGEYCLPNVGTKIGALRFYLTIEDREDNPYGPSASPAKISILEDETDGIETISATDNVKAKGEMFNLRGQRISNAQKGEVFIMNGKKFMNQ